MPTKRRTADRACPVATIRPLFKPGDAVLFLNTTPHRSYVAPGMTRPRYSFEVRYMPESAIASTEDPANLVDVTPRSPTTYRQ